MLKSQETDNVLHKGQPLSYDLNGNLTEYVDRYVYNWKNQLVRVERASGGEVHFKYDALGRRVEKSTTAGFVKRYLYDGWRVIEERDGSDALKTRYTYGNGLDEAVEIEKDRDGDGTLEGYTPVQNTVGSVVGIADKEGNIVERVDYTAYGAPTFIYDHASPEVEVVRVKDGNILIRFSEPVKKDKAQQAIKVKKGADEISGAVSFEDGDRVAKFAPSSALPQNEELTVSISTDLEDLAQNKLNQAFSRRFTYAGLDLIVFDRTAPEVESIRLVASVINVEFSEEIDPATITGAVELSSPAGPVAGAIASVDERTVKFTPTSTITPGITYTVKVKTGVKDLSGKSLSQLVTKTFNTSGSDLTVYQKPDPNHQVASYIGNTTLFQGREYDSETGLYYFRARYLYPELGRFLQADPLGYHDSMNLYQGLGMNPLNYIDPSGAIIGIVSERLQRALQILETTEIGKELVRMIREDPRTFNIVEMPFKKGFGDIGIGEFEINEKGEGVVSININYFEENTGFLFWRHPRWQKYNKKGEKLPRKIREVLEQGSEEEKELAGWLRFKGLNLNEMLAEIMGHELTHSKIALANWGEIARFFKLKKQYLPLPRVINEKWVKKDKGIPKKFKSDLFKYIEYLREKDPSRLTEREGEILKIYDEFISIDKQIGPEIDRQEIKETYPNEERIWKQMIIFKVKQLAWLL